MKLVHVIAASTLLCSGAALSAGSSASASTHSQSLSFCRDIASAREATPIALPPAPSGAQVRIYLGEVRSLSAKLRAAAAAALSPSTRAKLNTSVTESATVVTDAKALLTVLDGPAPTSVAHRKKVATDLRTLDAAGASFVAVFQSATALTGVCHDYAVVAGFAGSIAAASVSDKKPNNYVKTAVKELPSTDKVTATAVGKRWTVASGDYVGYDVCLTLPASPLSGVWSVVYGAC
jgi:hypothetical protein